MHTLPENPQWHPKHGNMSPLIKLFALGSNGSGQLGIGHRDDVASPQMCIFDSASFQLLEPNDEIIKVVAGGNHTLVLFSSGAVFAAGSNEFGQCGLPTSISSTNIYRWVDLHSEAPRSEDKVKLYDGISATWEASFFRTGDHIYVRGQGLKGELGLGEGLRQAHEKTNVIVLSGELEGSSGIEEIKSGMNHTVVLTEDGELLGWGVGRKGQLGQENKQEKIIWKPRKIGIPLQAAKIAVGRDFTFVTGDEDRWHCLLGDNKYESDYLPDLKSFVIAGEEATYDLTASWSNIYALTRSDHQLKGWGRNDRGQLPPKHLPKLKSVAAGSEHCVGLTVDGQVVAWGWGEHGNCGPDTDAQADVAGGRWNMLPVPLSEHEEVVGVGAGCATSFIIVSPTTRITEAETHQ
jgi:protein ATS1